MGEASPTTARTGGKAKAIRHLLPFDFLSVDHAGPTSLQRQLYWQFRRMIEDRLLPPGSRLQSSRSLALDLGISRTTVVSVYGQLATEGYVDFRPGARATVVDLPPPPPPAERELRKDRRLLSSRGFTMQEQPHHHGRPGQLAFHPGMPDSDYFPFGTWSRLLARRATSAKTELFGSHDAAGYRPLLEAIAGYVKVSRGVRCSVEQIVITAGAQAALDLLARVLLDPGDAAWVEEPGYYGAQSAFLAAGATLQPLYVGNASWDLEAKKPDPRLIYVTPASQQPLGLTMRMEQRLHLIDMADRMDAFIIEDDFDSEYRFRGNPIPAMQGADQADRVIYLGTFSKLLFPALRIGFMVLPKCLVGRFDIPLRITGQYASPLMQAALADFIDGGYMTTHLKRMRRVYAARRQAFEQLSNDRLGRWMSVLPGDAGISVVGELKDGGNDVALAAAARRRSLNVTPLSMHYRHGNPRRGIVMGYAALRESAMAPAFARLEEAFRETLGP